MCVLFIFSLSLATSERTSHPRCSIKNCSSCKIDRKIPVSEQAWKFSKKLHHRYFSFIFTNFFKTSFHRTFPGAYSIVITWNTNFWIFLSSNLPDTYLLVFEFTLFVLLSYSSSDNDHTNVLTKTRTDLILPKTTWRDLERPTTSKKRPGTTYNEQETTWNNLQQHQATYKDKETILI